MLNVVGLLLISFSAQAELADWTKVPVERQVRAVYEIETKVEAAKDRHFWMPAPADFPFQTVTEFLIFSVQPSQLFTDPIFGNRVLYWNHESSERFTLRMNWGMTVRNVLNKLEPKKIIPYDPENSEYKLYTQSGRLTRINTKVLEIKVEIERGLQGEKNPIAIARATYQWVMDHMAYAKLDQLDRDSGTTELLSRPYKFQAFTYYKGDCGEYTMLYNAILRAFGIPARTVVGGWSYGKNQWHVWSEVHFPGYGWVPVDVTAADVFVYDEGSERNALGEKDLGAFPEVTNPDFYFGSLDPFRFVISVGEDIPLHPQPDWDFTADKFSWFYHRGRAGVMQIGTFYLPALEKVSIEFEDVN